MLDIATTKAYIEQVSPLSESVSQIILVPQTYIEYSAGQYLQVLVDKDWVSYSIANAPLGKKHYELHIRHDPRHLPSYMLFNKLQQKSEVTIQLPFGHCYLNQFNPSAPLLFIAGGTGFAPIKAIIEQLFVNHDSRIVELFWGVRTEHDLYWDNNVKQWVKDAKNFCYYPVPATTAKEKLAAYVINHHLDDLKNHEIIIAGPFDMARAVREALLLAGANPAQMHSDAF